ncbi:hypothetical protein ACTZWW_04060 [Salinarimonas sp. NSM]|uniref:hypothetical protein n=1 Tax=Salinarimonas sp. NSM TaxID=3458003 RepID=UPI004036EDC2
MADTISVYNGARAHIADVGIGNMTLKVMLLDNTASFSAADATLTAVAGSANAREVSGNGWTAGGETLDNVAVTTVSTNAARVDADDVRVRATGGNIGPASAAVIYDDADASDRPLAYVAFDSVREASDGTDFLIALDPNGLFTFVAPS